jgi:hypothetical protein
VAEQVQEVGGCCREEAACCTGAARGRTVVLCGMRAGECGIIRTLVAKGPDGAYLRALGLRANQRIRLCRASGPWIVEVGCNGGPTSRIGLAKDLAQQVQVEIAAPAR